MALFGVKIENHSRNEFLVQEFNERINSNNPVFVMFKGKASLLYDEGKHRILFNVRVNPFEIPLYKFVLYAVFKRYLKKKEIDTVIQLMSSRELGNLLEQYL